MESKLFWGARAVIRKLGFFCLGLRWMIILGLGLRRMIIFCLSQRRMIVFGFSLHRPYKAISSMLNTDKAVCVAEDGVQVDW